VSFEIDPHAIADAHETEHQHYALPDFDGFSDLVMDYPENEVERITDADLHRTYIDALTDLHLLVDEYRFEALLALTLLRDYVLKRDRGDAPTVKGSGDEQFDAMPWPAEVAVVAKRYAVEPPNAAELFQRPHQQIAGGRILSRWFAAQMVDSALYRGIAACDRLAILLRCRAGLRVETTRRGDRRQPSFGRGSLNELDAAYQHRAEWSHLRALAENELFDFVKQERNGFTHERRRPSELHGERAIVYRGTGDEPEEIVPVMDAQTHYALAPAFYNEVLRPAVELTRTIVATSSS
jgi:hypothetical protein